MKTEFDLRVDLEKAQKALREIQHWNPLRNDLDAYLHALAMWGLGEIEKKPEPGDYGLPSVSWGT